MRSYTAPVPITKAPKIGAVILAAFFLDAVVEFGVGPRGLWLGVRCLSFLIEGSHWFA